MPFFSFLPHLARQPPKFGSLDALKQAGAGGGEDSDEEEQKFFVGGMGKGGGGSGQSVIDPKKIMESAQVRVPCDLFALQACDWAAFERAVPSMPAQQNGAVSSSQHEEGRSRAFMGSGYSLSGSSADPVTRNEDTKKACVCLCLCVCACVGGWRVGGGCSLSKGQHGIAGAEGARQNRWGTASAW